MRNVLYQRSILIAVGLWFTILVSSVSAQDVRIPPKSKALAHYILAVREELNGSDQQALIEYQRSVKLDPRAVMPRLRLGAHYTRLGLMPQAIAQFKAVIKLDPRSQQAHYLLAVIYAYQRKVELAVMHYEEAIRISPLDEAQDADVHAYLAQFYFVLGRTEKVQPHLEQVLRFQPKNVSALYLQGVVHLQLKDRQKAKRSFRQVIAIEPQHDGALNSLAYMYAEEGVNLDEAERMIRKAIDLDVSNGAYHDTLGWVLFKKGSYRQSLIALEKALSYINDPTILDHIGDVQLALGDPLKARAYWRRSLDLNPKQAEIIQKLEQLNKTSASHLTEKPRLAK